MLSMFIPSHQCVIRLDRVLHNVTTLSYVDDDLNPLNILLFMKREEKIPREIFTNNEAFASNFSKKSTKNCFHFTGSSYGYFQNKMFA